MIFLVLVDRLSYVFISQVCTLSSLPREERRIQVVWTDGVKGLVLPDVGMCVESPPAARTSAYDACSRAFELCTHIPTYPLHPSSTCPTRSFARAALHPASCSRPRQRQLGTAARRHSAKAWALGVAVAAVASRTYFSRAVGMAPAHEPRRGRTRPLSDESLPFERGGVIRHSARVNTAPPPVACQIALGLLAFHFSGSFGTGTLVPTHVLAVEDRSIGARDESIRSSEVGGKE